MQVLSKKQRTLESAVKGVERTVVCIANRPTPTATPIVVPSAAPPRRTVPIPPIQEGAWLPKPDGKSKKEVGRKVCRLLLRRCIKPESFKSDSGALFQQLVCSVHEVYVITMFRGRAVQGNYFYATRN